MLRLLHLLVAFLLLTASAGMPLIKHLCMGRVVDAALFAGTGSCHDDGCEGEAAGAKFTKCCSDEVTFVDVIQDAEYDPPVVTVGAPVITRPIYTPALPPVAPPALNQKVLVFRRYHPPPRPQPATRTAFQVYLL